MGEVRLVKLMIMKGPFMAKPQNYFHAKYLKHREKMWKTEKRFQNENNIDKFRAGKTLIPDIEKISKDLGIPISKKIKY